MVGRIRNKSRQNKVFSRGQREYRKEESRIGGRIRFGRAYVDVASAAGDEGVDEGRETRRPDPAGAGQEYGRLRGTFIGHGSSAGGLRRLRCRGLGAGLLRGRRRRPSAARTDCRLDTSADGSGLGLGASSPELAAIGLPFASPRRRGVWAWRRERERERDVRTNEGREEREEGLEREGGRERERERGNGLKWAGRAIA